MFELKGRSVVVTGAASGIGAAALRSLATQGASVFGIDRNSDGLADVVSSLRAAGHTAISGSVDVRSERECEQAVERCVAEFGRLDVLVNNAGVGHVGSIEEMDGDAWDELVAVNMTGVINCSRAAVRAMRTQEPKGGGIINLASVAGMIGLRRRFGYSATKGALLAMTRQMAIDYVDDQIRVNAICPGTIDTPFVQSYLERFHPGEEAEEYERIKLRQPVKRLGTAEEIAAAVVYLASSESAFTTGSFFVIDGGLTAG